MLLDKLDNLRVDIGRFLTHLIVEVTAIERTFKFLGIRDAQCLFDVGAHLVGGCRREGNDGGTA